MGRIKFTELTEDMHAPLNLDHLKVGLKELSFLWLNIQSQILLQQIVTNRDWLILSPYIIEITGNKYRVSQI